MRFILSGLKDEIKHTGSGRRKAAKDKACIPAPVCYYTLPFQLVLKQVLKFNTI
jgi:hypothetical protein